MYNSYRQMAKVLDFSIIYNNSKAMFTMWMAANNEELFWQYLLQVGYKRGSFQTPLKGYKTYDNEHNS